MIIRVPIPNTNTAYRIDLDKPAHQDWLAWRYVTGESVEQLASALRVESSVINDVIKLVSDRSKPGPRTGKPGDYTYYYLRKDLVETVSYVLDRFESLSARRADDVNYDMQYLQDLWGCDFMLRDKTLGERMKGGDKWSAIDAPHNEMVEAIWPLDHAFAIYREVRTGESEEQSEERDSSPGMRLYRFVSVTPQQVRGKVSIIPPSKKMLQVTSGLFGDNGGWECRQRIAGLFGGQWRCIDTIRTISGSNANTNKWLEWLTSQLLPSILTRRYNWHVAFGTIPDGPRLLLPTNPNAALRLFKNRELAAGQTRRQSLKHWVESHYRDAHESLEFVCHHLRGHTRFQWSDLACELFVSEYDLNMAEFFKAQANEWRSRRTHNRVKVRL